MNAEDTSGKTQDKASTEHSARRTLYVGIGVGVLLALAIVVAAARPDATAEKPSADKPAASAAATPSVPAALPSTIPSSAPSAGSVAASGAAKPKGGSKASSPRTPPGAPEAPAKTGSKLASLTAPPVKTIGMITVPAGFKQATYTIVYQPFGWGPRGQGGGRLIARIDSAQPTDEGARALSRDFAARNATLWISPELASKVVLGGSYTGTMVVRPQSGGVGVLYLTETAPKK